MLAAAIGAAQHWPSFRRLRGAAGLAVLGGLRGTAFVDPADPGAGFHDDGPALVAREPEAVEHARVAGGRAACLLDPAMQIIGGASGEVLDRLDAVLAQGDQHRRVDSTARPRRRAPGTWK